MGDPERYRTQDEVARWEKNDPIGIFHEYLTANKRASEAKLDALVKQAEAEIEQAVRFAEESPEPAPESLFNNVYVEEAG